MIIFFAFIAVMSVIDIILYGSDKKKAKQGKWRTKEATLLLTGFFGGAIGALIAMNLFRHKTKHWYFWAVNILGLVFQAAVFYVLFFVLKLA